MAKRKGPFGILTVGAVLAAKGGPDTELAGALEAVAHFIPHRQMDTLRQLLKGEEGAAFRDMLIELAERIRAMPHTYQTDGKGDEAIVHLHYFSGGCDWWITEKDRNEEQWEAFGYADLGSPELGYIPIEEMLPIPQVELDLYWTPKTLREVKAELHTKGR